MQIRCFRSRLFDENIPILKEEIHTVILIPLWLCPGGGGARGTPVAHALQGLRVKLSIMVCYLHIHIHVHVPAIIGSDILGLLLPHTLGVKQVRLFADERVTCQPHHWDQWDATQTGRVFTVMPLRQAGYLL